MKRKLWFVTNGISVLSVHTAKEDAEIERKKYKKDPDYEYYDLYYVDLYDLEAYPEEYKLALNEGLIG